MPLQLISKTSKPSSLEIRARSQCQLSAVMRTVILFVAVQLLLLTSPAHSRAQTIQYTQHKPDLALRSFMRVDPATLGLSIEVPIANYPARGGTSLPINLVYSSKQWRFHYYVLGNSLDALLSKSRRAILKKAVEDARVLAWET